jgi:pyruvate formate lyase activating enzyme
MTIGGLHKSSFIDYPEKVSCVLFVSGCNFTCPYCHNPDLVKATTPAALSRQELWQFLESRKELLDGVVISGGEPTLNPDLVSLCRKIKRLGYPIKIDTNGSRPLILKELIDKGLVDYIAMDIKTDPYRYAPLIQPTSHPEALLTSIQTIMASSLAHEFRTTCLAPFVSRDIMGSIARHIDGAMLYVLQRFRPKTVLDPDFFQGVDRGMDDDEMIALQSIAKPRVQRCTIR